MFFFFLGGVVVVVGTKVRRMSVSHVGGGWGWVVVVVGVEEVEEEKGRAPWSHVNGREESFERSSEWGVGAWRGF